MLLPVVLAATASAQSAPAAAPAFRRPSSVLAVTAGSPVLVGVRAEQWLTDDVEGELGAGLQSTDTDPLALAFDWAIRWRPDFACLGCGGRALVTFGLGPGGTVVPPAGFDGPWAFAVGADLGANLVVWVSPNMALQLGARGGGGAAWTGTEFGALGGAGWGAGSLGVAF
jgi:hypothetical protein